MAIEITGSSVGPALHRRITARMTQALNHDHRTPVTLRVTFFDDNNPKNSTAIRCALTVRTSGRRTVRTEATDADTRRAFDAAYEALVRTLHDERERLRDLRRRPKKYFTAKRLLVFAAPTEKKSEGSAMLHVVESKKSLDRVAADLEAAVARHKFGILGVHDLAAKMAEKGVTFSRACRVYEVCNPHQAKKVLEANLEISAVLPCRIALYEEAGRTKLATVKPTVMLALFDNLELKPVAAEVEQTLARIMADAAA